MPGKPAVTGLMSPESRHRDRRRARHRARDRDADGEGRRERRRGRRRRGARRLRRRSGPAQEVVSEIKAAGGKAIASTLSITEPAERRDDREVRARHLRPRRHPGEQRRHPARPHLSPHELVGLARRHQRAPQRLVQHGARGREPFPRPEFGRDGAYDLDLGPDRQFRAGELHGGEARHPRPGARHRARHGAVQCALELHLAVRMEPHDRLDPDRDRRREAARRTPEADDAGEDRAACGLSRLRQGRRHQRADHRRAQQRDLPVLAAAPDPRAASLRRLDAGEARRTAQRTRSSSRSRRWSAPATCSPGTLCKWHRLRQAAGAEDSRESSARYTQSAIRSSMRSASASGRTR